MGEKRKARLTNNERTTKKEKKSVTSVVASASNDDIEEQSSMHSNSSTSDSNSDEQLITKENTNLQEESETITPIDVDDHMELSPSIDDTNPKIINESPPITNTWWSSLVRLFHFGNNPTETKVEIDHQPYINENYLGNVKSRRSLHEDSLVG